MSQLTDYLRRLINDVGSTFLTDSALQVRLNRHRNFLNETIIPPENEDTELIYISILVAEDGVSQNRLFFLENVELESTPGTAIPGGEITSQDEIYGPTPSSDLIVLPTVTITMTPFFKVNSFTTSAVNEFNIKKVRRT